MTTTNTDIIATGGFNTGRKYSDKGQRIFWARRADGWVYFNDADRMISGWSYSADPCAGFGGGLKNGGEPGFARWIMRQYDSNHYDYAAPDQSERNPQAPTDLDYGGDLRI